MNFFEQYYKSIVKYDLLTKFNYKTIKQIPKFKKIVVNFKTKNINLKLLLSEIIALEILTLQKSYITVSKTLNITLKLKYGNLIGCKVTLRKTFMFFFFIKLFTQVFPYFNKNKNIQLILYKTFSFKITKVLLFPELENQYQIFNRLPDLEIVIVTNSNSLNELCFLLKSFKITVYNFKLKLDKWSSGLR